MKHLLLIIILLPFISGTSSCDPVISAKVITPAQAQSNDNPVQLPPTGNPGELDKSPAIPVENKQKTLSPIRAQLYTLAAVICLEQEDECMERFLKCFLDSDMSIKELMRCKEPKP
jgi:hypothetical protein